MAFYDRGDRDGQASPLEGGMLRPRGKRLVTDYGSSMVQWMKNRGPVYKGPPKVEMERPSASYIVDMLPPAALRHNPAEAIPARHLHSSLNKQKFPVNIVRWTPEGRRLLTGSSSGEFTLWNGMSFNFETIQQAHASSAIRAAEWSHNQDWLISADQDGNVRYWQPNINNVFTIEKAHDDPIRDLAFAPHDNKFVTASDDATLKIFDFGSGTLETTITGHNWDAKTVDWHPSKGLLVSGSKDHQVKLWDPRNGGRCLTTLHGHKNTISKVAFEKTRGLVLATCARDTTPRVFDLRMMRDICLLRGHDRDISTLVWHPIHHSLLTTGDNTGCMNHYLLNEPNNPPGSDITIPVCEAKDPSTASAQIIWPRHQVKYAHDFSIWSMDWHPLGHILASGSNDKVTRFWSRARPGETDCFSDRYHVGEAVAEAQGTWSRNAGRRQQREEEDQEAEDEAEGLKDQAAPLPYQVPPGLGTANLPFPGIPGMGAIPPPANGLPGLNSMAPPQPPPNFSMNPERLQALLSQHQQNTNQPPLPFLPPGASLPFNIPPPTPGGSVVPPPNWMSNMPVPPPNWDWSKGPPPFPPPPPGGGPPPNMNAPPVGIPGMGAAGIPGLNPRIAGDAGGGSNSGAAGVRKRAPLPSQSESLKEEMRRGNYRHVR